MTQPVRKPGNPKGKRKPPVPGVKFTVKNSNTSPSKLERQRRIAKALELKAQGFPIERIGEMMQEPKSTIYDLIVDGLRQIVQIPAEELRTLMLHRHDLLLSGRFADAIAGDEEKTRTCLNIMERQSKLLGLDAPTQTELSGALATANMTGAPSDTERARQLAAFIAMTRARKEADQKEKKGEDE